MKVHQKTNFARFAIIAKLILILSDQIFNLFDMIDLEAHVFVFIDLMVRFNYYLMIIVINKYSISHKKAYS